MTAEMVVLNKGAAAMAADSAVTIVGRKVYNSGSKLFPLSRKHSIGVMFYGNSALMGVPWETILSQYRSHILNEKFNTVQECTSHFIDYLSNSTHLFPLELQKSHLLNTAHLQFTLIIESIDDKIKKSMTVGAQLEHSDVAKIVSDTVQTEVKRWDDGPNVPGATGEKIESNRNNYKADIEKVISDVFQNLPLKIEDVDGLIRLSINLAFKSLLFPTVKSGVVFCGFGEKEIYPAICSVEAESVIDGIVKYSKDVESAITDFSTTSIIQPFAQQDVAMSFLRGIDPQFVTILKDYMAGFFKELGNQARAEESFSAEVRERLSTLIEKIGDQSQKAAIANVQKVSREKFVNPLLAAVEFLPKDELATMVETLVNLTSFRRKMSLDIETVGGPIDVAVISKKDGFIWIKRKHYFDSKLNRDFMERQHG